MMVKKAGRVLKPMVLKTIATRVPPYILDELRSLAFEQKINIGQYLYNIIMDYLLNRKPKKKSRKTEEKVDIQF